MADSSDRFLFGRLLGRREASTAAPPNDGANTPTREHINIEERRAADARAKQEVERRAAEERAKQEIERRAAEDRARKAAEQRAAEDQARKVAEQRAAEERAKQEFERRAAEDRARKAAEQRAAEDQARKVAEQRAAEERAKQEFERRAAEDRARKAAEQRAADERAKESAARRASEARARAIAMPPAGSSRSASDTAKAPAAGQQAGLPVPATPAVDLRWQTNTPVTAQDRPGRGGVRALPATVPQKVRSIRPTRGESGRWLGFKRLPPPIEVEFDLDVPYRKLAVFVRNSQSGAPIRGVPLYVVAVVQAVVGDRPATDKDTFQYPLGTLGTDHAGFASFDLTVLYSSAFFARARSSLAGEIHRASGTSVTVRISLNKLLVLPFQERPAPPGTAIDALEAGDRGPDFVVLPLTYTDADLAARDVGRPMASIQSPSLIDYRLSPSSFSITNTLLIGEDGCETMLPAGLSSHLYRFRQIAITEHKLTAGANAGIEHATLPPPVWLGVAIDYEAEWTGIGHSLGELSYSLALAPGEKTKVAVIDWSRTDRSERTEKTTFGEKLDHFTFRDRGVEETVGMAVGERQWGNSSVAGVSASASGPAGPISFGASASYSTASAESSGSRSLEGETVQDLADSFLQASSSMRELNSSVVVQGFQAELSTAQTRTVANYNHSHALTILYYGVHRHYKVVIRPTARLPVLLVPPYYLKKFEVTDLTGWAWAIEQVLLDPKLAGCLDKARLLAETDDGSGAVGAQDATDEVDPGEYPLGNITLELQFAQARAENMLLIWIAGDDGTRLVIAGNGTDQWNQNTISQHISSAAYTGASAITIYPSESLKWKDLKKIVVQYLERGEIANLAITKIRAFTRHDDKRWEIYDFEDAAAPMLLRPQQSINLSANPFGNLSASETAPTGTDAADGEAQTTVSTGSTTTTEPVRPEPKCDPAALVAHINAHRAYYEAAIYSSAGLLPKAEQWFPPLSVDSHPLDDLVTRRPAGVADGMLALPLRPGQLQRIADSLSTEAAKAGVRGIVEDDDYLYEYAEQLVTLPVRGVFAEAKLGHCNASEIIDNNRFWKWHEAPIPDEAPPIDPASTGSRYQALPGTTPTAMPGSMVNIVSPSAAPDPTGFTAASALMSAMGPFRDMSGIDAANSLAAVLTAGAQSLAAKEAEKNKPDESAPPPPAPGMENGSDSGGGPGPGAGPGNTPQPPPEQPPEPPEQPPEPPEQTRPRTQPRPEAREREYVFSFRSIPHHTALIGMYHVEFRTPNGRVLPSRATHVLDAEHGQNTHEFGNKMVVRFTPAEPLSDNVLIHIAGNVFAFSARYPRTGIENMQRQLARVGKRFGQFFSDDQMRQRRSYLRIPYWRAYTGTSTPITMRELRDGPSLFYVELAAEQILQTRTEVSEISGQDSETGITGNVGIDVGVQGELNAPSETETEGWSTGDQVQRQTNEWSNLPDHGSFQIRPMRT